MRERAREQKKAGSRLPNNKIKDQNKKLFRAILLFISHSLLFSLQSQSLPGHFFA